MSSFLAPFLSWPFLLFGRGLEIRGRHRVYLDLDGGNFFLSESPIEYVGAGSSKLKGRRNLKH